METEDTIYNKNAVIMENEVNKIKYRKKELKRIDWDIVKRLVTLLYYNSKMKRTNIAMKCKLSYDNCLLYLNWLDTMDLIKREIDKDGSELINITEKGRDLCTQKLH